jgi:hypothetical protein
MFFRKPQRVVFALFSEISRADSTVKQLVSAGFETEDISIVLPKDAVPPAFAGGALVGASVGWIVGLGLLGLPTIGPFLAAGPIYTALAGIGVGGAVGGLAGIIGEMGIPEYNAKLYEGFTKEGRILLSIHVDDRRLVERAKRILKAAGAQDILDGAKRGSIKKKKTEYFEDGVHPYTPADDYQLHK